MPLVAVGLMYRKGYFRQRIDAVAAGSTSTGSTPTPSGCPAALVTGADGAPLTITVPICEREVTARIWRVDVGRVPLFLLDTDLPENGPLERWITARLYDADRETRLAQYVLLGVGGVRALRALGIEPGVDPPQRGPRGAGAARARARGAAQRRERSPQALAEAPGRGPCSRPTPRSPPATTPTRPSRSQRAIGRLAARARRIAAEERARARAHRTPSDAAEPFGVTQAALRMSRAANAVSRRHGEVAREMWHRAVARRSASTRCRSATSPTASTSRPGSARRCASCSTATSARTGATRAADRATWAGVDADPRRRAVGGAQRQRAELVAFVRERSVADRLAARRLREYVEAAARAFDPDVLTIGFARRVATYKRLELLTRDPEWTLALLDGERPSRSCSPARRTRATRRPSASLQSLFGLKDARDRRRARRVPRRLRPRARRRGSSAAATCG